MLLGYIRPDARYPESRQREALVAFGVKKFYVEPPRKRGDDYPMRKAMVQQIRLSQKDCVVVCEFHRLASTGKDLKDAYRAIHARKAVIVEAASRRRSDDPDDLGDMILEATETFSQRQLSKFEASRIGKIAAGFSPVTKPLKGRMPLKMAEAMLNDRKRFPEIGHAIEAINHDKRWKVGWNKPLAYRLAREGKIKLASRRPGKKPKPT